MGDVSALITPRQTGYGTILMAVCIRGAETSFVGIVGDYVGDSR